jgi:hypothetical protein
MIEKVLPVTFWARQLNRIGRANLMRCELWPAVPYPQLKEMLPMYETLKLAFRSDYERPGRKVASTKELITQSEVSPFIIVPALLDIFSPLMNWKAIYENEFLRKGVLIKSLTIPLPLLLHLLEKKGAPQAVLQEVQQKLK